MKKKAPQKDGVCLVEELNLFPREAGHTTEEAFKHSLSCSSIKAPSYRPPKVKPRISKKKAKAEAKLSKK